MIGCLVQLLLSWRPISNRPGQPKTGKLETCRHEGGLSAPVPGGVLSGSPSRWRRGC